MNFKFQICTPVYIFRCVYKAYMTDINQRFYLVESCLSSGNMQRDRKVDRNDLNEKLL